MKWNNVRDYFEYQGDVEIGGSWDEIRYAFNRNLISDEALWLEIVQDYILSVDPYLFDLSIYSQLTNPDRSYR